jgi:hypothetical protein
MATAVRREVVFHTIGVRIVQANLLGRFGYCNANPIPVQFPLKYRYAKLKFMNEFLKTVSFLYIELHMIKKFNPY